MDRAFAAIDPLSSGARTVPLEACFAARGRQGNCGPLPDARRSYGGHSLTKKGRALARILIAEDEEAARILLSRALELDGHTIHAVADGAAALDYLQSGADADLLLTDISMPVMDGIALALAVSRDRPALPVLLMTGFADQRERASGLDALIRGVIVKPFQIEEVRTKVRETLGQ